jgi:hypothetical protein
MVPKKDGTRLATVVWLPQHLPAIAPRAASSRKVISTCRSRRDARGLPSDLPEAGRLRMFDSAKSRCCGRGWSNFEGVFGVEPIKVRAEPQRLTHGASFSHTTSIAILTQAAKSAGLQAWATLTDASPGAWR